MWSRSFSYTYVHRSIAAICPRLRQSLSLSLSHSVVFSMYLYMRRLCVWEPERRRCASWWCTQTAIPPFVDKSPRESKEIKIKCKKKTSSIFIIGHQTNIGSAPVVVFLRLFTFFSLRLWEEKKKEIRSVKLTTNGNDRDNLRQRKCPVRSGMNNNSSRS